MLKKLFSVLLVLLWMLIIFTFSGTNSDTSDKQSKIIVEKLMGATSESTNISAENQASDFLDEGQLNIEKKENLDTIELLNYIVRKIAHMTEYFILAVLVLNAIFQFKNERKFMHYIIAIVICFLYAATDEFHQTFIPGRTGQFLDVIIDTLGASVGVCVFYLIYNKFKCKKVN